MIRNASSGKLNSGLFSVILVDRQLQVNLDCFEESLCLSNDFSILYCTEYNLFATTQAEIGFVFVASKYIIPGIQVEVKKIPKKKTCQVGQLKHGYVNLAVSISGLEPI
jgi:hypothetical protein